MKASANINSCRSSQSKNEYFLSSGDQIRYGRRILLQSLGNTNIGYFRFFFDENAAKMGVEHTPLQSLNKVGHALHMQPVTDSVLLRSLDS